MDAAWTSIIEDHGTYSQIPQILSSENAALWSYLNTTYNANVGMMYEEGMYQPVVT
jgi:trehalose transport system substrate-binding protein